MVELKISPVCCGMWEINNISHADTPDQVIKTVGGHLIQTRYPFVIFTGVVDRVVRDHASDREDNYGRKLSQYLRKNKLGTIKVSDAVTNPRTGNKIRVWLWQPNFETLGKHVRLLREQSSAS